MNIQRMVVFGALAALVSLGLGCGPAASSSVVSVSFDVTVPDATPGSAKVLVVGNHASLGYDVENEVEVPAKGLKLRKDSDGHWRGAAWLTKDTEVTYRIILVSPSYEEVNASDVVVKRTIVPADGTAEAPVIAKWKAVQGGAKPFITFVVTVPGNTPADATLYMAGDFSEPKWQPMQQALTKRGDGKYEVGLELEAGTEIHYKFTRGSWATVEKLAAGPFANRPLTVTGSAIQADTVTQWDDLP